MVDWLSSMEQSFEYYIVDPITWGNLSKLNNVKSCSVNFDDSDGTLGSATIDCEDFINESYIRVYLVVNQNGVIEKIPFGTFLAQTPSIGFDGKSQGVSLDAYTPLIELKEKPPPIGFTVMKGANIMDTASELCRENMRAPVIAGSNSATLFSDFTASSEDTWLTYISDLLANAKYKFGLDDMGRVLFPPEQEIESLQPVWTYSDDDNSILYPAVNTDRDLYSIPNVVEVVYSANNQTFYSRVVNDDPDSPVSTVARGREIVKRVTDANISGIPTQEMVDEYAKQLLQALSALEYTVTYTHAYCPVRVGDCVRINYSRAGMNNVKALVKSQSIKCETGVSVSETAVFTTKLWG